MEIRYEVYFSDYSGESIAFAQCKSIADAVAMAKSCGVWADIVDAETGEVLVTYHDNDTAYSIF